MSRRLVVMRHAKAEQWGDTDHERELAARGRRDAHEAGEWLSGFGFSPGAALVSDATRTRATWAAVAEGAGWSLEPDFAAALYNAGPEAALDLIRLSGAGVSELLVIGHNPTMAYLAQLLDDGEGESPLDFPTAALVVFEYAGDWADLAFGTCRAVAFHVGRA